GPCGWGALAALRAEALDSLAATHPPRRAEPRLGLAEALARNGRHAEAAALYAPYAGAPAAAGAPPDAPRRAGRGLAEALRAAGDLPAALALRERNLAGIEGSRGGDPRRLEEARADLAESLLDAGDADRARALLEGGRGGRVTREVPSWREAPSPGILLAAALYVKGKAKEADLLSGGLAEAEPGEEGLSDSERMIRRRARLGDFLLEIGRCGEALAVCGWVEGALRTRLGGGHPSLVRARIALGRALEGSGRGAKAAQMLASAASELSGGAQSCPSLQEALAEEALAACLSRLGQAGAAARVCERVLVCRKRHLGPRHPDTCLAAAALAESLAGLGQGGRAESLAGRALGDLEAALGPGHPKAARARDVLARVRGCAEPPRPGRKPASVPIEKWAWMPSSQPVERRVLRRIPAPAGGGPGEPAGAAPGAAAAGASGGQAAGASASPGGGKGGRG
ncbi:MAG: tetratricopeptide repeat protein, partial [Deltaproteobacteria bacterium]|nr:tetratricopeptide repeat protein [Deltaproteobacteria bacterium]